MPYTRKQVAEHSSKESCWVVIDNKVYDLTNFMQLHPGGAEIILEYAGKDASAAFNLVHAPGIIDTQLSRENHLGELDITDIVHKVDAPKSRDELRIEREQRNKPPMWKMHSLLDLEAVARKTLSFRALAFYSCATDDEITMEENRRAFSRLFFTPRVMRPVSTLDPSTTILGFSSPLPIFVSAASYAKLGHPLGEVNITRACGRFNIIQMVSSASSCSFEELAQARINPDQPLFFQLYKHRSDEVAKERVELVDGLGYKAIFLTVDAVVLSNRERDVKAADQAQDAVMPIPGDDKDSSTGDKDLKDSGDDGSLPLTGTVGTFSNTYDKEMTWERTIPWLRSVTKLPIVVKGIQCVEDAVLAVEAGVDGILISNHGGRQMEYSMPSVYVLHRLRQERPDVFDKLEVYVDGGVRRGTDVLKCLCLGARAVGLGRPILYAQSAYGEAGVMRLFRILDREIRTGMAQLGAATLADLTPDMVQQVKFQPERMTARL